MAITEKTTATRVVHFEMHCDDPERAADFYRKVFDWNIKKWDGPMDYWLVMTGDESKPGIDGGLLKRRDPSGGVYNTVQVPSVDDYLKRATDNGGTVVVEKTAVPGVGWMAYFKDTENNIIGIMEPASEAK